MTTVSKACSRFQRTFGSVHFGLALLIALIMGAVVASAEEDPSEPLPPSFQTGASIATPGVRGVGGTGPTLRVRMRSVYEMRWEGVVRQKAEIGCAAASLATLLSHYFAVPTDEETLLNALVLEAQNDPQRDYRLVGFNLKHIRNVASRSGLVARAFRMEPEDLAKLKIPVLTRVTIKGYDHFVVLRGAEDGRIFVADPAFGNTSYRLQSFKDIWSGVVMAFVRRGGQLPDDYELLVQADDKRFLVSENMMRSAPVGGALRQITESYGSVPIVRGPPLLGLQESLRSVLPVFLYHSVEF